MSTGTPDENDGGELPPESSPDEPAGQWLGTWIDGRQIDPALPPPPPIRGPGGAAQVSPWAPPVQPPGHPEPEPTPEPDPEKTTQHIVARNARATDDPAPNATVPNISTPGKPEADTPPPEAESAPQDRPAPERTVTFGRPPEVQAPADPTADALPQNEQAPGGRPPGSGGRNLPAAKPTVAIEQVQAAEAPDARTAHQSGPNRTPNTRHGTGPTTVYDAAPNAPHGTGQNSPHGTGPNTVYDAAPYGTDPNAPHGTGENTVYDAAYGTDPNAPYGTGSNTPAVYNPSPPQGPPRQGLAAPYPGQAAPPPGHPGAPPNQPVRSPWQQYTQAQPATQAQNAPTGQYGSAGQYAPPGQTAYQGGPPAQQLYAQPVSPTAGSLPYEPWRVAAPVRGRSRGRIFVAVAAVVALGLVIAGSVYFFTGGHSGSAKSGASLAGSIFTSDPAATSDGRDQELLGAATSGETVVAVGDESDDIAPRAQFLVSTDGGHSFSLASVRSADGGEPPYGDVPQQVAGGTGAWIALGSSPTGTAIWTSPDAKTWTREPDAVGQAFAATDQVNRIVRTGSGFVAVGDSTAGGTTLPVVWRSADGTHWNRATEPQLGMAKGTLSLVNAAASGNTVIVHGVGTRPVKKKRPAPVDAVWRSADGGQTWQPSQVPVPAGSSGIAVAATGSGFYVARNVPGRYAVVLGSTDGRQWAVAGQIRLPGYGSLLRLAGSATGLAAAVTSGQQVLLARSSNGAGWQSAGAVPLPSGRTFQDVALTDRSTVLVGREMAADANAVLAVRGSQGQPITVDLSKIPGAVQPDKAVMGVTVSGTRAVAVGSTNGHAAAWTSTDGKLWSRGSVAVRPGRQRLLSVTAGSGGWLAVGYNGTTPRRPMVITSANGTTWQAADSDSAFKPTHSAPLATYAAASGPGGYVVVGEDSFSAAVWHSTDLRSWRRGSGSSGTDLDGTTQSGRWMRDVVGESSGYVAVGGLNDPTVKTGPQDRPAAWTSTDGQIWTLHQLPLPTGATGGWCDKVAAKNGLLLATGTAATPTGSRPFVFVSSNGGSSWGEAALPSAGSSPYSTVSTETTTPNGFVIAGTVGRPGATNVVLWTSKNGTTWTLSTPDGTGLSGGGDHKLTGLTTMGTDLVAVGTVADHLGKQPTLWLRPPP